MKAENMTVTIPVCLKIGILEKIESTRGSQNRSARIREILEIYFDAMEETQAVTIEV